MKVSVCLPATRPATVGATIRSIQAQTVSDWELLVVGQGNDHQIRQVVEAAARADPRLRYVHIDKRGSSRARNAAMQAASGEILAMTDDDCEARPDWLAVLTGVMAEGSDVALVGGALIAPPPGPVRPARCPRLMPADVLYDPVAHQGHPPAGWDWIGANFAVRREVAERLGDFDEFLGVGADFPCGGDSDYKSRMEALGLKMRSTPRAVVYHTYGWRYGLRAVLDLQRRYARGMGALAAKLTLQGDPRGRHWLQMTRRDRLLRWLQRRQPHRLPTDLRILWHACDAYGKCLHHYRVNARGLLVQLQPATDGNIAGQPERAAAE
jgi:glycosyltransferase involved in cell wall biosynthesis